MEYNPRVVVDVYLSTVQHWSTEEFSVTDGTTVAYQRRLLASPNISKEIADVYWGVTDVSSVTLKIANHDAFLNTLEASEEFRGVKVRIRRYEPNEPISANTLRVELIGYITEYNIINEAEITVGLQDLDPLQAQLPKKLFEKADWTETPPDNLTPEDDVGTAYCLPFGYAKRVPLRYVHLDYPNDYYDYIICPGVIEGVDNLYRSLMNSEEGNEHELITPSEYTVYKGDQDTPYTGYAFVRFPLEQMSFSMGTMHQISADVRGYPIDSTSAERNFVSVIKGILSNSVWGLGMTVDSTSFAVAATQVSDLYCDGHLSEQENAQDVIDELLFCCRGTLDRNEAGAWTISVDQTVTGSVISAYFGSGDGILENIVSVESLGKASSDKAIKSYIVKYAYNAWKSKYARTITRTSDFTSFGVEETKELRYVWDGTTANKISEYVLKRTKYSDTKLKIVVGQEGRLLRTKDLVSVTIPRLGINSEIFQVFSIDKELATITLDLVTYDPLIFTYGGGTIPDEPEDPNDTNWENVTPNPPTNFSVESSGTYQTDDGFKSSYAILKTDIPTANATEIQIGYRVHNEPYYTFNRGDADSTNAVVWRVRIDGLGQGLHYDFTAKTLNIYGLESDVGNPTILDWTAPSDSAAPATPANLTIVVGTGKVISTDWDDNTESDLSEYRVYRKTGATQPATPDQGDSTSIIAEVRASRFVDIDVETDGTKYWYWVSALDTSENESALVGPVSGTPEGIAEDNTPPVQITDFHVDSTGTYQSSNGVTYAYIDFGWTNPALHFAFTRLLYKRDTTSTLWMIADMNFDVTTATGRVDDLTPGLSYNFKVVPVNGSGVSGPDSTTITRTAPGDTTAPGVPVLSLSRQGRVITASVVPQTEADLGGYEFHASLVTGFTPDSTSLKQRGGSNVYTHIGTADTQPWYFKARTYDLTPNYSAYCSQQTISTEGILVDDGNPPATPTGLALTAGIAQNDDGSDYSWIRATWNANGESDLAYYEYRVKETGGNYIYGLVASNSKLFSPVRSNILHYVGVRAIDIYGNPSAFCTDSTITSSKDAVAPGVVTDFTATSAFSTIFLTWTLPADKDIKFVEIFKSTDSTRAHATSLAKVNGTFYADKVPTYGSQRWYWARTQDLSDNTSVTEAGSVNATTATVAAADITDFAINATKINNKVIALSGDTWTDHSPSSLYVAWNSHTLYYNGVAYTVASGNTINNYIWWSSSSPTVYQNSATLPTLTDSDFIIATNVGGVHDLAWNAMANSVIGSAYIQDGAIVNAKIGNLAVDNAKINDLNAAKINAGDVAANRLTLAGGGVNLGSTLIAPGKIQIDGTTSLTSWIMGGDVTKINGGAVSANTITANKLSIGSRNISFKGIEISANYPTPNTLYWTGGIISYVNDAGTSVDATTTGNSQLWSSGILWLYWVKDTSVLLTTPTRATAFDATNVVLATYAGTTDLVANYGRTLIDGSKIITDSITASQIAALTITSNELATGSISTDKLSIGSGVNICNSRYCDFEEGSLPTVAGTYNCIVTQDATQYYFGAKSLKMACSGVDAYVWLGATTTDYNIKLSPGKKWIVSAYVRCSQASKVGTFILTDTTGSLFYSPDWTTGTANTWIRVYGVIDMSSSTQSSAILTFRSYAGSGNNMWFDGIQIEEAWGAATTPSAFAYPGTTIITGSQITANSIKSLQLDTSNLITLSAQIGTAVITDAKIADLTVGKLSLNTALRNVIRDGGLELGDLSKEWNLVENPTKITLVASPVNTGAYALRLEGTGSMYGVYNKGDRWIPVQVGQKYHLEYSHVHSIAGRPSLLYLTFFAADKVTVIGTDSPGWLDPGTGSYVKRSKDITIPAGTHFMNWVCAIGGSPWAATNYAYFDDMLLYQMTDTDLIVDNAVNMLANAWTVDGTTLTNATWNIAQQATVTTSGKPCNISFSNVVYQTTGTSGYFYDIKVFRDANEIYFADNLVIPATGFNTSTLASATIQDKDNPPAGTYTYYVKIYVYVVGIVKVKCRSLIIQEVKK
jgi:hypothetical protein